MSDLSADVVIGAARVVRDVFDAFPVLMVAVEGEDHRLVATNAVYRTFAGRGPMIGKPAREAFPDIAGQLLFELLDRVWATGEPVVATEWRLQMVTEDGGPTGDLYIDVTLAPWHHADGSMRGILITQADVTERVRERQRVERDAAQAQQRYLETREVVHALQAALLPTSLPVLPNVQLGGRYLLAADSQAAGGDWFEAVVDGAGCVSAVVGDVVGHGSAGSAAMGLLRGALAAQLRHGASIAEALEAVDEYASTVAGGPGTTVCVAQLDPATGRLAYCTAGHPPPLVLARAGGPRYLQPTGGGPLCSDTGFVVASAWLEEGDMVLLYSDGIVERPNVSAPVGTVELLRAADAANVDPVLVASMPVSAPDRVCSLATELLCRQTGVRDDVTLMAMQRVPTTPPLSIAVAADALGARHARQRLAAWLRGRAMSAPVVHDLVLVVNELVWNSIEHASIDMGTPVCVEGELVADGSVEIRVVDGGRWRDAEESSRRGLGLPLVRRLVDRIDITSGDAGTTTSVRRTLACDAGLLDFPVRREPPPDDVFGAVLDPQSPLTLRVRGPVDAATLAELEGHLTMSLRQDITTFCIDLDAVTLLSSAALQLLRRTIVDARAARVEVRLRASPGTVAHHVLTLVALPVDGGAIDAPGV